MCGLVVDLSADLHNDNRFAPTHRRPKAKANRNVAGQLVVVSRTIVIMEGVAQQVYDGDTNADPL